LGDRQVLEHGIDLCLGVSDADKDGLVALLLERLEGKVAAQHLAILQLHAQVEHELDLKVDGVKGQTVLWDLRGREAAVVLALLKHGHVLVAEAGQERCARDGRRARTDEGDLGLVRRGQLVVGRQRGVADLRDLHLLERLHGKVLQAANVYSSTHLLVLVWTQLLLLMGPSSTAARLHPPTQRSLVGQTIPFKQKQA